MSKEPKERPITIRIVSFIFRMIAYPFMLCIAIICYFRFLLKFSKDWLWYGGEVVLHKSKDSQATIQDIYDLLKTQIPCPKQ